jgi:hypothetical protein
VGKSISTIKRAVRELCHYGAIKRAPRFRKDGGQTSNLYEIVECDFEKLIKKEREAKNKANYKYEVELQYQDIKKTTTFECISNFGIRYSDRKLMHCGGQGNKENGRKYIHYTSTSSN